MNTIKQRTEEWLQLRKTKIGASDAPIIMKVSPWKTPYQLWLEKISDAETAVNFAMRKGIELEDEARELFQEMTGMFVVPDVVFHPIHNWMMASLDGIDIERTNIVEIKYANKVDHELAKNQKIPTKYYPQLQHQMEVCGLNKAYYFSYNGNEGVIVEVEKHETYVQNLLEKEKHFWDCTQNMIFPED